MLTCEKVNMSNINLSFIFSTRNRLEFLRVVLQDLQTSLMPDEEIIVVDALSNDGTTEFLNLELERGAIHQLITEADRCQAEGWNKGMLMSRGTLIKKITDDDVFDFNAIRRCKDFMLAHPEYDACISNELFTDDLLYPQFNTHSFFEEFKAWKQGSIGSFFFSDPHLLLRRSALAYIGLYNPRFIMIDYEYSLRISQLQANIAYFSGYNSMSFFRRNTVSGTIDKQLLSREYDLSDKLYSYKSKNSSIISILRFKLSTFIHSPWKKKHKEGLLATQQFTFSEQYHLLKEQLIIRNAQSTNFITHV